MELSELSVALKTLVFFRPMMKDVVLSKFEELISSSEDSVAQKVDKYCSFVGALYEHGDNFSKYLLNLAVFDDNKYIRMRSSGKSITDNMQRCLDHELSVLSYVASTDADTLGRFVGYDGELPSYEIDRFDFISEYQMRISDVNKNGYGIYAHNVMFRYDCGEILPVMSSDKTDIDDLIGYENEKKLVIDNTQAFLKGLPAADVLLCGDAGTGKSSTVKAVANMFAGEGLRMLELRKDQLHDIPTILEHLKDNPLKFILFIDDLSFTTNDDDFNRMKAILQGSVSARSDNVLVYATSNRRHLVKEKFSDRVGDDIHRGDTMQELLSLSERFGLTVLYQKPDKKLYLEIVHRLCERKGIAVTPELDIQAEAFALRRGNRSARAAEQFTDMQITNLTQKERKENDA